MIESLRSRVSTMEVFDFLTKLWFILSAPFLHYSNHNQESTFCDVNHRPYTILVEGNVGSGKSTLLKHFSQRFSGIDIVYEPVDKWQNFSGTDLLEKVLEDKTGKWSLPFQLYSSLTRYENDLKPEAAGKPVRMMERSVYTERFCFLETMLAMKGITEVEAALMEKWFETMTRTLGDRVKPDLIIYIRCSIDVLEARIRHRARPEERNMDPEFLRQLQRRHEDYLFFGNSTEPAPTRVVVLDGNLPLEQFLHNLDQKEAEILAQAPIERD